MGRRATDYGHREHRQEWPAGCRMDGDVQVGVRERAEFSGTVLPADEHADLEGVATRHVLRVCHQAGGRQYEEDGADHGIRVPGCKGEMRDTGTIGLRAERSETEPHEPVRFAAFAQFFKAYMGTASVVTASLPIPLAAFHLIPTYAAQEKFLSTYTSLFCFLMLGYLFYIRHSLGRLMFYTKADGHVRLRAFVSFVPLLLLLTSLSLGFLYHHYLMDSLTQFSERGVMNATTDLLKAADYREIPDSQQLSVCYLGMFLTAEAAFILMALREYLQDVLHLQDIALIRLPRARRN